ncbi:MAG: hypothetical protein HY074_04595 [Deltaproteobacteria bacterium]|nr:hypothetical protein [Deltaproteobacteria bacterium]
MLSLALAAMPRVFRPQTAEPAISTLRRAIPAKKTKLKMECSYENEIQPASIGAAGFNADGISRLFFELASSPEQQLRSSWS